MRPRLEELCQPNTGVCVGIDPDPVKIPIECKDKGLMYFINEVVSLTQDVACAYKLQRAFFDLYEKGPALIAEATKLIHEKSGKPVFVDAKIGDTGNTMNAYLGLLLKNSDADGITVNPYMGDEVFQSLAPYSDRGILVLLRTSNPNASSVQDILVEDKIPLWSYLLGTAMSRWNNDQNIIPVLSGNVNLQGVREKIGDSTPVLYAGVGAQQGDVSKISYLLNSQKSGVFVNSSRGIVFPYSPEDAGWRDKIRNEALDLAEKIKEAKS